jgi:hypothetical protein
MSASLLMLSLFALIGVAQQAAEPTPKPMPAGMKGSDPGDPRSKLSPGLFDAGETAMGLKHVVLLK